MGTRLNHFTKAGLHVSIIYVLSKNNKNITILHLKITIFTAVKNCSILNRLVIVMVKDFFLFTGV